MCTLRTFFVTLYTNSLKAALVAILTVYKLFLKVCNFYTHFVTI